MIQSQRKLHFGAFINGPGHHLGAWRHPKSQPDGRLNLQHLMHLTKVAERGLFDTVFLADGLAMPEHKGSAGLNPFSFGFEPVTLFSALSVISKKIGFIATASTTYEHPFHVARKFASLDLISNGRCGCNFVTTWGTEAAGNFGFAEHMDHGLRYERANEFLDVVKKLWDSWEDGAALFNRESGVVYDKNRVREIHHTGKYLKVRGPLNIPRPVQGYPVIVQAGASDDGKDFAAKDAEVVFCAHSSFEDAKIFYADIKGRLAKHGRNESQIKILPGLYPVIGKTESEARSKHQELQELILPNFACLCQKRSQPFKSNV